MRKHAWQAMGGAAIVVTGALTLLGGGTAYSAQGAAAPAAQAGAGLNALNALEHGEWTLTERGAKQPLRKICLGDARQLLQVRHGANNCSRFVVTATDDNVVVTYDCGATGNGRTDLRVETPRLAQVMNQGIADGAPFSMTLEARRTGVCH